MPDSTVKAATLTDAIDVLTRHTLRLAQVIEDATALLHRTTQDIHALQTAALTFGELLDGLQRRVDRLERQASPLHAVGRVQ